MQIEKAVPIFSWQQTNLPRLLYEVSCQLKLHPDDLIGCVGFRFSDLHEGCLEYGDAAVRMHTAYMPLSLQAFAQSIPKHYTCGLVFLSRHALAKLRERNL